MSVHLPPFVSAQLVLKSLHHISELTVSKGMGTSQASTKVDDSIYLLLEDSILLRGFAQPLYT